MVAGVDQADMSFGALAVTVDEMRAEAGNSPVVRELLRMLSPQHAASYGQTVV